MRTFVPHECAHESTRGVGPCRLRIFENTRTALAAAIPSASSALPHDGIWPASKRRGNERRETRMLRDRRMEVSLGTATLLAVLTATTLGFSQQENVAESLFRQARAEMKSGQPAAACPKFEESYRLDPSSGTLLNLALCEEALGNTATAWTKLRQFLDSVPAGDSRLPVAREKMAKLEAVLPRVQLVIDQGDDQMLVQLDHVELRNASLSHAIPVNPGEHAVRVTRSTGESNETIFRIQTAEKLEVRVSAPPRLAPAVSPPGSTPPPHVDRPAPSAAVSATPKTTSHDRSRERAVAYGLGAVGVAGLVTSGVFGLMALHDRNVVRDQCPNHECDTQAGLDAVESGARNAQIANVALVVGALGLVTGGVLFWHSDRAIAAVSVTPSSASLSLVGVIQ